MLNLVPKKPDEKPIVLAGSFTRADCTDYAVNYMWRCPRIAFATKNPHIPIYFDSMILTEAEMDCDATYAWYGKHGLRYYVAGWSGESATHRAHMSLQRSRRQGHIAPEQVEQFSVILPHVARAYALASNLGTLRSYQRFSSAMLEALPQAVFALDSSGRLLFANGAGTAMLASHDGLTDEAGRLRTAAGSEQVTLDELVRSAIVPLHGRSSGWTRVSRSSGRLPLAVYVGPLNVVDEELNAAQAKVLVMAHDTGEQRAADPVMLTSLYDLTETEARLASALSAGHSIESAASLLRMQPATARTHLKKVFQKVGVNRQQDLVRRLASLSTTNPGVARTLS